MRGWVERPNGELGVAAYGHEDLGYDVDLAFGHRIGHGDDGGCPLAQSFDLCFVAFGTGQSHGLGRPGGRQTDGLDSCRLGASGELDERAWPRASASRASAWLREISTLT